MCQSVKQGSKWMLSFLTSGVRFILLDQCLQKITFTQKYAQNLDRITYIVRCSSSFLEILGFEETDLLKTLWIIG